MAWPCLSESAAADGAITAGPQSCSSLISRVFSDLCRVIDHCRSYSCRLLTLLFGPGGLAWVPDPDIKSRWRRRKLSLLGKTPAPAVDNGLRLIEQELRVSRPHCYCRRTYATRLLWQQSTCQVTMISNTPLPGLVQTTCRR